MAADLTSVFPSMNQQFSKEIEDEANSYFQRIYNHPPHPTISTDDVIEMLKRFKDSPSKKERVRRHSSVDYFHVGTCPGFVVSGLPSCQCFVLHDNCTLLLRIHSLTHIVPIVRKNYKICWQSWL